MNFPVHYYLLLLKKTMVQIEATVNPRVRTASSPAHSPHPSAAVDSPPCPHSALPTWPKHTRASFFSPGLALSAGPASPPPLQAGQASRAAGGVCRPPSDWADIQGGAGSGRGQEAPARSSVQPWERGPLNNNQTAWLHLTLRRVVPSHTRYLAQWPLSSASLEHLLGGRQLLSALHVSSQRREK